MEKEFDGVKEKKRKKDHSKAYSTATEHASLD